MIKNSFIYVFSFVCDKIGFWFWRKNFINKKVNTPIEMKKQQALTNSPYVCSCLSPSQSNLGGNSWNEKVIYKEEENTGQSIYSYSKNSIKDCCIKSNIQMQSQISPPTCVQHTQCACNMWQRHFEVKELCVYIVNTILDVVDVASEFHLILFAENNFRINFWMVDIGCVCGKANWCKTQTAWTAYKYFFVNFFYSFECLNVNRNVMFWQKC